MSEYIKREDALDKFKRMPPSPTKDFIIETLNAIPAADVEPVVRCGRCTHASDLDKNRPYCDFHGRGCGFNDYCNFGEERER